MEESMIKKETGKVYGMWAFIVSEILVILGAIAILLNAASGVDLGGITATHVFTLQGTIFATTWATVSANKVTKNIKKVGE